MRRILITGGAGFIGSHLAERLCRAARVVVFDNFRRNSLTHAEHLRRHPNVTIQRGDVMDPASVAAAMDGVDTVLHLASIAGVSSTSDQALDTLKVNMLGTANLLDAVAVHGARRFVQFSTSEIYGSEAFNVDEEQPASIGPVSQRRWAYATAKFAAEMLAVHAAERHGFEATCIRPFNIFGPRQTGEGAIANFVREAVAGRPLTVYGNGADVRAWCYIDDMTDAIEGLLATPHWAGNSFNIGNPRNAVSTTELAETVIQVMGAGEIAFGPAPVTPIRKRIPDVTLARSLIGFRPRVGLTDGIVRTVAWQRVAVRAALAEAPAAVHD